MNIITMISINTMAIYPHVLAPEFQLPNRAMQLQCIVTTLPPKQQQQQQLQQQQQQTQTKQDSLLGQELRLEKEVQIGEITQLYSQLYTVYIGFLNFVWGRARGRGRLALSQPPPPPPPPLSHQGLYICNPLQPLARNAIYKAFKGQLDSHAESYLQNTYLYQCIHGNSL